ncbi:MAG TPA: PilZ domain-containing protein [Candidatus Acidoferrum sp.]|nr:PilZ domain-containing protein [Candidatus Acidoferrum sp.]
MNPDRRGFRFSVDAAAEIAPENAPTATVSVKTTELSLHGCHIATLSPFTEGSQVFLKIFYLNEYFEAKGTVVYVQQAAGMGVEFRDLKPHFRIVLQRWILEALRRQPKSK